MDDFIHQSTFDYINHLNSSLEAYRVQNVAYGELSLQIILHMISCASAIRDILDSTQKTSKHAVNTNLFHPFLNGLLATVGKLIMDSFSLDIKSQEVDKFSNSYQIFMRHSLRLFPEMVTKKHKTSGKTLLHHVAFKAKANMIDNIFKTILSISPDAASMVDATGALPLHWATRNSEVNSESIETLVQANPHSLACHDQKGFLPLHWAINQDQPNQEVVRKLLKIHPEAAKSTTSSGSLPLHYCVSRENPSLTVIKLLVGTHADSVRLKCKEGYLPLHRYVHRAPIDVDILRQLIQYYPAGLTDVTNRNQTPLHVALDFPLPDPHGINIMLNLDPAACGIQDADGYFPLHLILDCAIPDYATAQRILLSYPDAAKAKTKDGMFPLHLLVSTNDNPPSSFVTMLLEANPQAIDEEVRDIVPAIDGVALVDPESWSGEWVEKSWSPKIRAKERGLIELEKLFQQFPRISISTSSSSVVAQSAAIKQSQPIRTIPEQTPPKRFIALQSTQTASVSSRLEEESMPEEKFQQSTRNPFPNVQRLTSSPVMNIENIEEDRQEGNEPLIDNFVGDVKKVSASTSSVPPSASSAIRQSNSNTAERGRVPEVTAGQTRAPPAGPIPTSILQAAESNALRLSKAQYEFLKSGKINKKAIRSVATRPRQQENGGETSDTGDEGNRPQKGRSKPVVNYSSHGSDSEDNLVTAPVKLKKSGRTASNNLDDNATFTPKVFSSSKSKIHPASNKTTVSMDNDPHEMV
jgi:hypothetical protein